MIIFDEFPNDGSVWTGYDFAHLRNNCNILLFEYVFRNKGVQMNFLEIYLR